MKCILFIAVLAIGCFAQVPSDKTDHELLVEIRSMLALKPAAEYRAQLILKKIDLEQQRSVRLEAAIESLDIKIEENADSQVNLQNELRKDQAKAVPTDATEREDLAESIRDSQGAIVDNAAEAQTLQQRRARYVKQLEISQTTLASLERELSHL